MATVRTLNKAAQPAWDAFVSAQPEATFFHRAGWADVIAGAFGHRAHYLMAEQDGAITGILPLVEMRTALFGHSLVSAPFCVYGGPIAVDAESRAVLLDAACRLQTQTGAHALELRFLQPPAEACPSAGWASRDNLYVTFRKPIAASDTLNMAAIPRKQRAMVRKGIDAGLVSHAGQDVDVLHHVYAQSVRNLGTPVFPRRYFRLLAAVFGNEMDVVTISKDDAAVASVLNFYWRDEVLPYYGGGIPAARTCAANDFMYWEVMRRAAAKGCRVFDFGRSKPGTGSFAFKRHWGFEAAPLTYRYKLRPGSSVPDNNPLNPKYRLFIAGWKRLPLPVANALGPMIVRGIG